MENIDSNPFLQGYTDPEEREFKMKQFILGSN